MKSFFNLIILITSLVMMSFTTLSAQNEGNKFSDNITLKFSGGIVAEQPHAFDLAQHGLQWYSPEFSVEIGKDFTPWLNIAINEGVNFNTTPSYTAIDQNKLVGIGTLNLTNIFCGYNENRTFNLGLSIHVGWLHNYGQKLYKKDTDPENYAKWTAYYNHIGTDGVSLRHCNYSLYGASLPFTFNFSKKNAVGIEPKILYFNRFRAHTGMFSVGVFYKHTFNSGFGHDEYVSRSEFNNMLDIKNDEINDLKNRPQTTKVVEKVVDKTVYITPSEIDILFKINETNFDENEAAKLNSIPLKSHVIVEGYASPSGNKATNLRLANERAYNVANYLKERGVIVDEYRGVGTDGATVVKVFVK